MTTATFKRIAPVALAFSTIGLTLSGCNHSSATQGFAGNSEQLNDKDFSASNSDELSDKDFKDSASTDLNDGDFKENSQANPQLAVASKADTPATLYRPDATIAPSGPAIIIPQSTITPLATQMAVSTIPTPQQAGGEPPCVEGAEKGAAIGVLGSLGLAALDVVTTGGTFTAATLLTSIFAAGAKGAVMGCTVAAVTGSGNSGATAVMPTLPAPAPDYNDTSPDPS